MALQKNIILTRIQLSLAIFTSLLFLQACESKVDEESTNNPITPNQTVTETRTLVASSEQASAFLSRTTFGVRTEDITYLQSLQFYDNWIDEQMNTNITPISSHYLEVQNRLLHFTETQWNKDGIEVFNARRNAWFSIAIDGKDQLRQRVAFALSEIIVISDFGPLVARYNDGMAVFYDILVKNAFGNYRDILKEVTYNPMMGRYLGMSGNAKADPSKGSHADENYAREIMQLFSLGLENLNLDGTSKGTPTYTQEDIENLSRVFTGWSGNRTNGFFNKPNNHYDRTHPMRFETKYHDYAAKNLLGHNIEAGLTPQEDISHALDIIFSHPNVAPFISKQLIMRLVTSNPSPSYVARVATVFNDNGNGIKGDLAAVIKAILLDDEALKGSTFYPNSFGKLREPLIRLVNLYRSFHAVGETTTISNTSYTNYGYVRTDKLTQVAAMNATTVFNYFSPHYKPQNSDIFAPEFQISAPLDINRQDNFMMILATDHNTNPISAKLNYDEFINLRDNPEMLINKLNILLMSGNMSNTMQTILKEFISGNDPLTDDDLIKSLVGLIISSSEYSIQR